MSADTPEIELVTVEARPTAVLGTTTTWREYPGVWPVLLDEVHASVRRPPGSPIGLNVMLYLDDRPAVEVGLLLGPHEEITGRPRRSGLPAGRLARAVHVGAYEDLDIAHAAIRRWCADRGLTLAGPRWEVYGHWDEEPARRTTEVSYLVR